MAWPLHRGLFGFGKHQEVSWGRFRRRCFHSARGMVGAGEGWMGTAWGSWCWGGVVWGPLAAGRRGGVTRGSPVGARVASGLGHGLDSDSSRGWGERASEGLKRSAGLSGLYLAAGNSFWSPPQPLPLVPPAQAGFILALHHG